MVFALALALLLGCSDDTIDSLLVGNWEGISFTTSVPVDENNDGEKNTDLKQEMDCISMEAEFTAAGRFSLVSTDATYDIEIVNGEVVLVPTGCTNITETGHWTLNSRSTLLQLGFSIPGKDEPTLVDVPIELTENRLVMKDLFFSDDEGLVTFTVEFRRR